MTEVTKERLEEIGAAIGVTHDENSVPFALHKAEIALIGMAMIHYVRALQAGDVADVEGPDDAHKQELVSKYLILRLQQALEDSGKSPIVTH